jgi:hypothetical protein
MDKYSPSHGSRNLPVSKSTGFHSRDACQIAHQTHYLPLLVVLMDKEKDSLIKGDILALLLARPSGLYLESLDRPQLAIDKLVMISQLNRVDALWKMLAALDGMCARLKPKYPMPSDMMDPAQMLELVSTLLKCLDLVVEFVLLIGEKKLPAMVLTAALVASPTHKPETTCSDVVL